MPPKLTISCARSLATRLQPRLATESGIGFRFRSLADTQRLLDIKGFKDILL